MNYGIELNGVTVRYGSKTALENIRLNLEFGKIYGLLGRNGAGKTTLLSLIASFMKPTSGTVSIGGREVFENPEVMPLVSFIYSADYQEESEKVKGMLEASERYRPHFDKDFAERLVKEFQLPLDQPMKKLSKGQQAAVNAVIGLANRSPITIFDEAYLGMDAPTRERFYNRLLEDHERHPRTILMSTHYVSEVDHLFEEVIIVHRGRILMHEPIDRLLERGASVTGAAQAVDRFVANSGMKVLHSEQLGGTKQTMIYGSVTDDQLREAKGSGLQLGQVSLQQLFAYLTEEGNTDESR